MNYKDYPPSVAERKAAKTENAKDWTPRDALITLLREIDNGEVNVDALVIAFREKDEKRNRTRFLAASPDSHTTYGLLETAKLHIWSMG